MCAQNFKIGAEVFVRDDCNRSWLSGQVTNSDPLLVQVQGWPVAMPFEFVVNNKPVTEKKETPVELLTEKTRSISTDRIGQVIGATGKMLNRIRRTSRAKITVYDSKSRSVPRSFENLLTYYCVVKIVGSQEQVDKAMSLIDAALQIPSKWQAERRKRRNQAARQFKRTARTVSWASEMWYLQKKQHGANGSWFTRKFKNRGKKERRSSKSQTDGSWFTQKLNKRGKKQRRSSKCQKKNFRKTNRKQTVDFANRRLSF